MKPWSLRARLTLLYTVVLALLTTALAVTFHSVVVSTLLGESTRELEARAKRLVGYLTLVDGRPALDYNRADLEETTFVRDATLYFQLYRVRDGLLIEQSPGLESLGLRLTPEEVAEAGARPGIQDIETEEGRLRLLTSVTHLADGEIYVTQVGENVAGIDRTLAAFDRILVWRIMAGLLAAALAGMWLAGRGLSPLRQLAAAVRRIDVRNLGQRLPTRGAGDELDEVAVAFNQALARVERSVGEMRQFSAALAHELRTPLAILRGQAEVALKGGAQPRVDEMLAAQIEEFDRLTALINQILMLARAEAGEIQLARDEVDVGALAASIVDDIEPVAASRNITLTSDVAGAVVRGDRGWLQRLLLILIDNAIKYTPDGGRIAVVVSRDAGGARLVVRDTGAGIPADALPHLFERFYRVDPARSSKVPGAGLGLALARWIADQHKATIEVESRPGAGSAFTVTLPAG